MKTRIAAIAATGIVFAAQATDVTVMSAGAVKTAFTEASGTWEKKSGHRVNATFGPMGELRKRIDGGETADILIVAAENLPDYEKGGVIVASSRKDLGVVSIGVAVQEGRTVPPSVPHPLCRTGLL